MNGYVIMGDRGLRHSPGPAPALHCVQAECSPRRIVVQVMAWMAYPELTEAEAARRLKAMQALSAWYWRLLAECGEVRISEVPAWAKKWRKDRVQKRCYKTFKRVDTRLKAAQMAGPLAIEAAVNGPIEAAVNGPAARPEARRKAVDKLIEMAATDADHVRRFLDANSERVLQFAIRVGGRAPSIRWLAEVESRTRHDDDQSENIRNRTWYASRPVLHLADALLQTVLRGLPKGEQTLQRLMGHPEWAPEFLADAEHRRCLLLPVLGVPAEQSIQII